MKTKNLRVSLAFTNGSDGDLESTARKVLDHVYNNPSFPAVPVPANSLKTTVSAFSLAREAQLKGGRSARSEKNARRIALVRLLQQVAFYVQKLSHDDLPMLLSSGFRQAGTKRTPSKRDHAWVNSSLLSA